MNIFYIPSWYPSKVNSFAGVFFKEQAISIGAECKDCYVGISLWGQDDFNLSLRRPYASLLDFFRFVRASAPPYHLLPNVIEFNQPTLKWTPKFKNGNFESIIKANIHNLQKFKKNFGNVDIIHAHVSYPAGYIAMRLGHMFDIPYIITEHMSPFPFEHFLENGYLPATIFEPLERADAVIAVSNALAHRIAEFGFRMPIVIPNIVDENFFTLSTKNNLGNNRFQFFTLGNMIEQKGIPDLLMAISILLKKNKDVTFRIGGNGVEAASYKLMADSLGISSNIQWLGSLSREQVLNEFQQCDCFVLTSHHETFGVVYAEALACGKPIIATRCGGPEDIVTADTGLLVEVGQIEEIALALQSMIDDPKIFDSNRIRSNFLERFSKPVVVKKIHEIYERVISKKDIWSG